MSATKRLVTAEDRLRRLLVMLPWLMEEGEVPIGDVAERFDMKDRDVLEIGCGKGDFLEALVKETGTRGLGIDPGFLPERGPDTSKLPLSFRREYFDPETITEVPDFIMCRHTLEHIPNVGEFMEDVVRICKDRTDIGVMFETPSAMRVFAEGAFWDIYHEHCSYFTIGSHARLFRQVGLDVTESYLAYDDQYIIQYAKPGSGPTRSEEEDLDQIRALAEDFPQKVADVQAHWTGIVDRTCSNGGKVAVWGGGSKCVAFLTTLGIADKISHVIDINPHKQGRFLPGTRLQVSGPSALKDDPPELVIVMNPIYLDEIGADLKKMGLTPEMVAV